MLGKRGGNYMEISLKNIGKVQNATIEINSISLIAGNNNMGKSTIGKSLFAITSIFEKNSEKSLLHEQIRFIYITLDRLRRYPHSKEIYMEYSQEVSRLRHIIDEIDDMDLDMINTLKQETVEIAEKMAFDIKELMDKLNIDEDYNSINSFKSLEIAFERLEQFITIDNNPELQKFKVVDDVLRNEFFGEISTKSISEMESSLHFNDENNDLSINFLNQEVIKESLSLNMFNPSKAAIYIEDPYILDSSNGILFGNDSSHKPYIIKTFRNITQQTNSLQSSAQHALMLKIFNKTLDGELEKDSIGTKLNYFSKAFNTELDYNNLSTGMKSFAIMKLLIESGLLEDREYLILDEPEIHLHPEWQIEYARLIVNISKVFPIKILITSHSPYFIEALDIFSQYENIPGVKYYRSISSKDLNGSVCFKDVTNNTEEIFLDMYKPLNYMRELREEFGLD